MTGKNISSGLSSLDELTQGLEIGSLTFVQGALPWVEIEIWLSIHFAIQTVLGKKGSAAILCFHSSAINIQAEIQRLYPEIAENVVIGFLLDNKQENEHKLTLYECIGKQGSQVIEAVRKVADTHPSIIVLNCVRTAKLSNKEFDKDMLFEIERIARVSNSAIVILPYGASVGLLPPTDPNEHRQYMEDGKKGQGEFGFFYNLEDRWLKIQLVVNDKVPDVIDGKLKKGIVRT